MTIEQTYALGGNARLDVLTPAKSQSATGVSSVVHLPPSEGQALVILDVGVGSGSLAVTLQHSDDNSTFTETGLAFVTNTGTPGAQQLPIVPDDLKEYLRLSYTVTTGPFLVSAVLLSLPQ